MRLAGSQLAVYAHVEALFVAELRRRGGFGASTERAAREGIATLAATAARLLREVCVSVHLLAGGAGCTPQLQPIEEASREQVRLGLEPPPTSLGLRSGGGGGGGGGGGSVLQLKRMSATQAIAELGAADRQRGAQQEGFVSYAANRKDTS